MQSTTRVGRQRIASRHVTSAIAVQTPRHDLYRRTRENVKRYSVVELGRAVERPQTVAAEVPEVGPGSRMVVVVGATAAFFRVVV